LQPGLLRVAENRGFMQEEKKQSRKLPLPMEAASD
jgi:hypothetical protein